MSGRLVAICAGLAALGLAGTAKAVPVDLELSLVVDSSGSISNAEFTQQVSGYAAAFRLAPVIDSIVNAPGGIAVNTILFSSGATEVIEFRQLQTQQEVLDFADDLEAINRIGGGTVIASGINLAVDTLAANNFESDNVIIDVSGDGTSSQFSTQTARDNALASGVDRINGLAIGGDNIFNFYQANVIGGPNAFVLQAEGFDEFADAIGQKIAAEVGASPTIGVPEPGVVSMLGAGLLIFGFIMRRRQFI